MVKFLLAAALCASVATIGDAAVTVSVVPGPTVDLTNIHVGDNFEIDPVVSGPLGEAITFASGNVSTSANITFSTFSVGNFTDDLSTNPVVFKLFYNAAAVGPATFTFTFADIETNLGSYLNLTTNTLSFPVLPRGGVPEPASWAMMLVGFGVVGAGLRSRRRALGLA